MKAQHGVFKVPQPLHGEIMQSPAGPQTRSVLHPLPAQQRPPAVPHGPHASVEQLVPSAVTWLEQGFIPAMPQNAQ
jgi:hypothetical protein